MKKIFYLIYKNKKFIGFTTDKIIIQQFKELKKNKYIKIIKISEEKIDEKLKNKLWTESRSKELIHFTENSHIPLFGYETLEFEKFLFNLNLNGIEKCHDIDKLIKYIKFSEDEKKIITKFIISLFEMVDDITAEDQDPEFDMFFKIDDLIRVFLQL
jgi:hypothetical protein